MTFFTNSSNSPQLQERLELILGTMETFWRKERKWSNLPIERK